MQMKANKAFFVIGGITAVVVFTMVGFLFSGGSTSNTAEAKKEDVLDISLNDLSPEELRSMGIEGDTSKDTVRTLVGRVKENNKRLDDVISQNDRLMRENEQLRNQNSNTDYQIQQAVQAETGALIAEINSLKDQVLQGSNQVMGTAQQSTNAPLPINGATVGAQIENSGGMTWVNPSDMRMTDERGNPLPIGSNGTGIGSNGTGIGFPKMFDNSINDIRKAEGLQPMNNGSNSMLNTATPFFTIAANSTLTNSVAMTALVGRVPIDNNVTEPYPFKLLIGRDNLIANGIELPDIEGAIVSGTASGDWTLSCVRGDVKSLTFVFSDGRIVSTGDNNNKIGWLSDPHGVPCIPGERKTNAPEYLTTNFLLTGASAAAQGLSSSQSTTVVDGGAVIGAVTGNNGKYVLGQALGGGLKETADWFRQRYGQMFDAVYVPPGREVAVHIDQQINIDYDRQARQVKYGQTSQQSHLD